MDPTTTKTTIIAGRVRLRVRVDPNTGFARDMRYYDLNVDGHGHVDFDLPETRWHEVPEGHPFAGGARHSRVALTSQEKWELHREWGEELEELGIVELKPVGPEDSEYFLTHEAQAKYYRQLQALRHDWDAWEPR